MDDLYLGLIANHKKMARSGSTGSFTGAAVVRDAIQILEAKAVASEIVRANPKEFADFIIRNSDEIVASFERKLR